ADPPASPSFPTRRSSDLEPGDTLAVRLDSTRPNRKRGITAPLIAPNVLDPGFQLGDAERDTDFWTLDLERGTARLDDGPLALERSEEHTSELQSPDHLVC